MNICACKLEDEFLQMIQTTPSVGLYRWCPRFRVKSTCFLQTNQSWKFSFLNSVCRSPQTHFPSQWKPYFNTDGFFKDGSFFQHVVSCNLRKCYTWTTKIIYQKKKWSSNSFLFYQIKIIVKKRETAPNI